MDLSFIEIFNGSKGMSLRFKHGSSIEMIKKESESGHFNLRNLEQ